MTKTPNHTGLDSLIHVIHYILSNDKQNKQRHEPCYNNKNSISIRRK